MEVSGKALPTPKKPKKLEKWAQPPAETAESEKIPKKEENELRQ